MKSRKNRLFALLLTAGMLLSGCSAPSTEDTSNSSAENTQPQQQEETVIGQSQPLPDAVELPEVSDQLQQLNQLHEAVIAGIYNRNWDDPMEIDPESFPTYYQYLIARVPELEEQSGKYTDEQLGQTLVPQESLESVVTSHFAVSAERIRESSCYHPEQQAYELSGIGGGASVQIVSSSQDGDQLVMEYQIFSARNLPMSHGTITAEVDGENWIYRSVTNEEELSYLLEEPNAMGQSMQDDAYVMVTESSLSEIQQFYRQTLQELGIQGEETQPNGENSWGFEGSDADGRKVSLQVEPQAENQYQICYTVEE